MNPGSDTVTFVSVTGSQRDSLGNRIPVKTNRVVKGCLVLPRRLDDTISDTEFSAATHLVICPVKDAVLAVQPEDRLLFDGIDHRVIGKKLYRDWWGRKSHVKVMCEEQSS